MNLNEWQKDPKCLPPEYVRDQDWLQKHLAEFHEHYAGMWIAILNEQIIAFGDGHGRVRNEVMEKYPDAMPVFCLVESEVPIVYTSESQVNCVTIS